MRRCGRMHVPASMKENSMKCPGSIPQRGLLFLAGVWLAMGAAAAQPAAEPAADEVLVPSASLVLQGIPPIPMQLVERVSAYADFRGHGFVGWHPLRNEMLVTHRPAGASVPQLYRLNEPMGQLEPLTTGLEPVLRASYEPQEGRYLVYQRAPEGSEAFQLYRLDLDAKRVTALSSPDAAVTMLGWRPGSAADARNSMLFYLSSPLDRSRAPANTALWVMDPLQPGTRRKLAELPGVGWSGGGVSPDGQRLALNQSAAAADASGSSVWTLDVGTGELIRLLPMAADEAPAAYEAVAFSKDGKRLFAITDKGGEFRQLMAYGLDSRQLQPVQASLPWDVQAADLSADGKALALTVNVDGQNEVRLVDTDTLQLLPQPPLPTGTVRSVSFQPQGQRLAFTVLSQKGPGQIHVLDPSTGATTQWTRPYSPAGIDPAKFAEQKVIRWTTFDGRLLSGLLSAPPARFTGKRPVLVVMHGGPAAQSTANFLSRWNYVVQELGVAIVEPNVRGSSGYGKTFLTLDDGMRREDAVKDIGALLDWIAQQPDLDASRVLVTGGSYGGYMALAASVHFGDRIAGGLALAAPSNLATFLAHTESHRRDLRRVEYGDERDPLMKEFLEKTAPLNQVDKITKPLFIAQGKNDPRVDPLEAEQIVNRLRERGQPVWYLRADDEGHGFARKENGDFLFFASVRFVEEILLKP
jgi:poly(3-hydroxybutyrate) depolymerase/Tol biopolymer transport system component